MHLSKYLKIYPCQDRPGYRLVFSTKQFSKLLVPEETLEALGEDDLTEQEEELLLKHGILTEDPEEEMRSMLSRLARVNAANTELRITVVLNLDCNFDCVYCYEGEMKGKHYLSPETEAHLLEFIKQAFTSDKKKLHIDFHGGEPLLSQGMIERISRELKPFVESRGAEYTFGLITNGSLLTRKTAEKLSSWGLENAKITIDGPRENHDRTRPFKSGEGSFDLLIRNIKETAEIVKISLGGNYDRETYRRFVPFLDYLLAQGITPDKLSAVKFDPIVKQLEEDAPNTLYTGGSTSVNEPWIHEAGTFLREEILKRGFSTPKPAPMTCIVDLADAHVVNYDGVIYKCPAFIGKKEFATGDVKIGVGDSSEVYKKERANTPECRECAYLPMCEGGCRYLSYVRNGNIEELDCVKEFLDATLETLIKQDMKYQR